MIITDHISYTGDISVKYLPDQLSMKFELRKELRENESGTESDNSIFLKVYIVMLRLKIRNLHFKAYSICRVKSGLLRHIASFPYTT
uniref:Uncharacterized protein n=1 Tax=Onchocerca flexuosa TaxID=387005 RepID=A0A183HQM9_9BILA